MVRDGVAEWVGDLSGSGSERRLKNSLGRVRGCCESGAEGWSRGLEVDEI